MAVSSTRGDYRDETLGAGSEKFFIICISKQIYESITDVAFFRPVGLTIKLNNGGRLEQRAQIFHGNCHLKVVTVSIPCHEK